MDKLVWTLPLFRKVGILIGKFIIFVAILVLLQKNNKLAPVASLFSDLSGSTDYGQFGLSHQRFCPQSGFLRTV